MIDADDFGYKDVVVAPTKERGKKVFFGRDTPGTYVVSLVDVSVVRANLDEGVKGRTDLYLQVVDSKENIFFKSGERVEYTLWRHALQQPGKGKDLHRLRQQELYRDTAYVLAAFLGRDLVAEAAKASQESGAENFEYSAPLAELATAFYGTSAKPGPAYAGGLAANLVEVKVTHRQGRNKTTGQPITYKDVVFAPYNG